ncbi:HxsD-like protein [Patescibacteria group bacterium]
MENIIFNQQIYSLAAVNKAVIEFKDLAKFTVQEKDKNINVKIEQIDADVKEVIKDEFANYVLGLMS